MILVGPSLGAAIAIDFAVTHPEAVSCCTTYDPPVWSLVPAGHLICFWNIFITFLVFPLQVKKLVLIDASVYAEGAGNMANLPRPLAYAGVNYPLVPSFEDISI